MYNRAIILLLLVLTLSAVGTAQRSPNNNNNNNTVSGSVRTTDDQAVPDARVELRAVSGSLMKSGYTSFSGSFEFQDLPVGSYEVIVTAGANQTTEHVQVQTGINSVNVRMSPQSAVASTAGNHTIVSVAQMKVPQKARDAFRKAQKALEKNNLADAAAQLQNALAIYPDFAEALTMRGLLALEQGKAALALPDLEKAVEIDQGSALEYLVLGSAYNVVSRFDDAIRMIDRGIALSPSSWQAYFEMGKSYLGKLDYQASLKHLNKAADLAPKEYAPLHLVRANVYLSLKNYPEAMAELESYLERDPQGPDSPRARKALDQVRAFTSQQPGLAASGQK
jgi:tetratricopeptide (TPR) repeat protein